MLVVMHADHAPGDIDAVCAAIRDGGFDADVFADTRSTVVAVSDALSPVLRDGIAAMPGVHIVVPGSAPAPIVTRDLRIESNRPLLPPAILVEQVPLPDTAAVAVRQSREEVIRIVQEYDDRLIVVVGPCSIHDDDAALDYARRLKPLADELAGELCIVMRVYFEKPRTTVGWKGLINDPRLDGTFAINDGLVRARHLLVNLVASGVPVGCEFLDPILPQFFADTVTWGAIGARTTESQVHRELASGLSMPVGFKNGTGGGVQMAIDAVRAAAYPHRFLGVTEQGLAAIVATRGNADCHIILRGGTRGPNYDADSVQQVLAMLRTSKVRPQVMIDASHGNSDKDYRHQPVVAHAVAQQVAAGERGIIGVMLESFLVDGRQEIVQGTPLVYGQSVTDSCMGWEMTVPVLRELADAVRLRRETAR